MHTKEENNCLKKVQKHTNSKMAACLRGNQDGRYFCKIVYVFTDPQMYRSFESINNLQRFDFVKIFAIPGGNAPPKKSNMVFFSATLPNRSGMYQGTSPTTWLNFYTPCKSQLQNAWPVSPTISADE